MQFANSVNVFPNKHYRFHPRNGVLFPRTICIEPNSIKLTIRRPMWPFLICALKTQCRFHHHGATWKFCWKFPLFGSGHRGSFRFWAVTNLGPQIACGMKQNYFFVVKKNGTSLDRQWWIVFENSQKEHVKILNNNFGHWICDFPSTHYVNYDVKSSREVWGPWVPTPPPKHWNLVPGTSTQDEWRQPKHPWNKCCLKILKIHRYIWQCKCDPPLPKTWVAWDGPMLKFCKENVPGISACVQPKIPRTASGYKNR